MRERPPRAGLRYDALNVVNLVKITGCYCDVRGFSGEWRSDRDNVRYHRTIPGMSF